MLRRAIVTIALLVSAEVTFAQSHPVFYVTPARETVWAQMKTDYDANPSNPSTLGGKLYAHIKGQADSGGSYYDWGMAGAWMYHVTGNTAYATQAYGKITSRYYPIYDDCGDPTRQDKSILYGPIVYDWIYPALTVPERSAFLTKLNFIASCIGNFAGGFSPFRPEDSDQTAFMYLFMAMFHSSTTSYNSTVNTVWDDVARKLGGYTATASDFATYRNAMKVYAEWSGGGEFLEGSDYNDFNVLFYLVAIEAVRSARGSDDYPEWATFTEEAAAFRMQLVTPSSSIDNQFLYLWGDVENGMQTMRERSVYEVAHFMGLAGLSQGTAAGQRVQDFIMDYIDQTTVSSLNPVSGLWAFIFNPYATRGDYKTSALTASTDVGLSVFRTGWDHGDSVLYAFTGQAHTCLTASCSGVNFKYYIDHQAPMFGSFNWWANDTWAIRHQLVYSGPGNDSRGSNGLSIGGLNAFVRGFDEYTSAPTVRHDAANGFSYYAVTEGGDHVEPTFLMEHSRALVWLPTIDFLVVYDRVNALDPKDMSMAGYSFELRNWMQTLTKVKELFITTPVSPTLNSGYAEWTYSGANKIRMENLLPIGLERDVENQATVWGAAGYYSPGYGPVSEKKYHIRVTPDVDRQWDTFLQVYQSHTGSAVVPVLVRDTSANVDGVVIPAPSLNRLVTFNAIQGPNLYPRTCASWTCRDPRNATILDTVRLRDTSFSLSIAAGASPTRAILTDLDPGTVWTVSVNGGIAQSLTVDSNGISVYDIATTGNITVAVIAGGETPDPPVVVQTSGLASGIVGTAYVQDDLEATGGDGGPYTWSIIAGALPTSVSLSAGGAFSGTPSVVDTFEFTVQACDSTPLCGSREMSIVITDTPTIVGTFDNGTVGVAYSDSISAVGGVEPYVFSLTDGALCSGLALSSSGVITGTPTTVESCTFEVTVTDDDSVTDTEEFVVQIGSSLATMSVRAESSGNALVVHFSTPGLTAADSCTVDIVEGETTVASNTTSTGRALRTISFTGLSSNVVYGIDVVCGQIHGERLYIATKDAVLVPATVDYVFRFLPHSRLAGMGVERVSVLASNEEGGSDVSSGSLACSPSCSVTMSLERGTRYSVFYSWEDSGENQIANSKIGMLIAVE